MSKSDNSNQSQQQRQDQSQDTNVTTNSTINIGTSGGGGGVEGQAASNGTLSSSASNGDTSQSINVESPDDITIRNVASPDTPNSYPTAPCRVAVSAGFSLPGGALSGGGSIEDKECTLRETARSFSELGVPEMGLFLLCQQSDVVNGWQDRKNKDEKGARETIGYDECIRLVRGFQGDDDNGYAGQYSQDMDALRREQQALEEELMLFRQECSDSASRAFAACQRK